MPVTAETIESYFEKYEWTYERVDDSHFVTGFKSNIVDIFSIYITLTPNWVYFTISPFLQDPIDPECECKLYKHLLQLCQQMNMAKFTVNTEGVVILTVELPSENLAYSEFVDALETLSYYADETYLTIKSLATDTTAISGFLEEQDLDWGE